MEPINGTFIDLRLSDDSKFLEFLLARPLSQFRQENWVSTIEVEYRVYCGAPFNATALSTSSKYTFMVIIEDGNSYPPEFDSDNLYNFNLTLPWSNQLNKKPLKITDRDINFEFANITVSCVEANSSVSCDNFQLILNDPKLQDGYVHSLDLYFSGNSTINALRVCDEGDIFSVGILVNDSIHSALQILTFTVEKVLKGKAGLGGGDATESSFPLAPVIGIGFAIAVICGMGVGYTTWRNRKTKNILRKLTETEIREFLDGATGFVGLPKRSVDCNTPILALPYNKAFEIPRNQLRIGIIMV